MKLYIVCGHFLMIISVCVGGYHFELDNGKVRWFHRNEYEKTVFSLITTPVVEMRVWMHFAATYDAYNSVAKVCLMYQ